MSSNYSAFRPAEKDAHCRGWQRNDPLLPGLQYVTPYHLDRAEPVQLCWLVLVIPLGIERLEPDTRLDLEARPGREERRDNPSRR